MPHLRSTRSPSPAAARRDAQRALSRSVRISLVGGAAAVSLVVGAVTSLSAHVSSTPASNQGNGSQGSGTSPGSGGTTSGAQVSPGNGGAQHAKTRGS